MNAEFEQEGNLYLNIRGTTDADGVLEFEPMAEEGGRWSRFGKVSPDNVVILPLGNGRIKFFEKKSLGCDHFEYVPFVGGDVSIAHIANA